MMPISESQLSEILHGKELKDMGLICGGCASQLPSPLYFVADDSKQQIFAFCQDCMVLLLAIPRGTA